MHHLTIESRDGIQLVRVTGELDTFGAQAFRSRLSSMRSAEQYIVDLGGLTFVDSAGLHALFSLGRVAKDVGATIVLVVPADSPIRRLVELVRLADVAPVCESDVGAAARLLEGRAPGSVETGPGLEGEGAG